MQSKQYSKLQLYSLFTLRVLIGWYFLYEGLAKVFTPNWSAYGYLIDSKGVFAPFFVGLAENPEMLAIVNFINIWGLTFIGLSLILGLVTNIGYVGAIFFLLLYYLSHPPLLFAEEYMEYMTSAGLAEYVGPEPRDKFSLERFFRWRCWWDYSTGLSGDLLTHEYDAMNQILKLGIPSSASSSGGVYYFKDGRTVPDVLQTAFEFKDKDMTMLYSATLANQFNRSRKIMGHDATMEVGNTLTVTVDQRSDQYRQQIDQGIIKPGEPFYTYLPGQSVDAVSTATERYFAERGLLYSFIGGKRYNTTFLHMKEWLDCIRTGSEPSCGIDQGFEEAITAHMGTRAYLEGRTMYWDKDKEIITRE